MNETLTYNVIKTKDSPNKPARHFMLNKCQTLKTLQMAAIYNFHMPYL